MLFNIFFGSGEQKQSKNDKNTFEELQATIVVKDKHQMNIFF
jgi:hypothetical protein